jgi:group I intron endonuclease
MLIYVIKNTQTDKCYIGQTINSVELRFKQHKAKLRSGKHSNKHLQYAWNKYGADGWYFEILAESSNIQELNLLEIEHIKNFTEQGIVLYNVRKGGDGGGNHSDITKSILSKKAKEQWNSDRDKLNKIRQSQWTSEFKLEMSVRTSELWNSADYRNKQKVVRSTDVYKLNHKLGIQKASDVMSSKLKDRWSDANYKEKASNSIKESLNKPDIRKKHLEALDRIRKNPEYIKNHKLAVKQALSSEDVRNRISKSLSKYFGNVKSPEGEVYEVVGIRAFCRLHKLGYSSFRNLKYIKNYSYRGWQFIHENNN